MIPDPTLERIHRRLARALAPPAEPLTPFDVGGAAIGWITGDRVERLAEFADVFDAEGHALRFVPAMRDIASRTAALDRVAAQLASEGALTAWRDERYAVAPSFGDTPLFFLERAAARYFGVHTYAVHLNGLVRDRDDVTMWLARRSDAKAIDPGMLDNLVGGGIAAGATVADTVVKESWEEAGIGDDLARTSQAAGLLHIFRVQRDGVQHATIFVHDLWLPHDCAPENQDGEAVEHRRVALAEAARLIAIEDGPEAVTSEASLVALDCLLRLGQIGQNSPWRSAVAALRISEP